jgi:hypothetical protein
MEKTDRSGYNISIAAIKRKTIPSYDFKWTRIYEDNAAFRAAYPYGDFKGFHNQPVTLGAIQLPDGSEHKYFIETGRASMVMIYGVTRVVGG